MLRTVLGLSIEHRVNRVPALRVVVVGCIHLLLFSSVEFGVLKFYHLVVLLHKSQEHQLDRVESQLCRFFLAQKATEFVEPRVGLVVLTDELGA